MNKLLVCAVCGVMAASSANATIFTWTGKNGSLSGSWSDTACWQGGMKPDVHAEDSTISGNRYSAVYLPRSAQDYTITLDEDAFVTNCYLQVKSGTGTGGTITITGHGKKLTTRPAKGPGVNNICLDGATLKFVDVAAELRGCNALGGEIVIGNGASFTTGGYSLYCDTDNSRFTVEEGGVAQIPTVDNRGNSLVVTVNGGTLTFTSKYDPVNLCKGSRLTVNGGTFLATNVQFKSYSATKGRPEGAKCEINGGVAVLSALTFAESSTNSVFAVNGGVARVSAMAFAAPNEIRLTGGLLEAAKPDRRALANVTFTGGTWTLPKKAKELLTYEDHPLLPQGDGVLNAQSDSTDYLMAYGISLLASQCENVEDPGVFMTNALFSGTIQVTNRQARTDFYTRGGDSVVTVGNRGKLIVPAWSGRQKGAVDAWHHRFDLELFVLTYGCHAATWSIENDFVNGVTIGANGDWDNKDVVKADGKRSGGNISHFKFNDYVTFDTRDYFNKTDTHKIEIYKAQFSNVTNLTVKGGGEVTLVTLDGATNKLGEMDVQDGTAFNFPGAIKSSANTTNALSSSLITADNVRLGPNARLSLNSIVSTLHTDGFVADETSEIVINCPFEMSAGGLKTRIKSKTLGQYPKVTVTGAYSAGWTAKNVAGVIYLADGTTPALPAGSKPYTWSGAVSGNFSDAGNWFGGSAPSTTSAGANELVFAGIRNTVITNDLTSGNAAWLSIYNLQFASGCGPVELHGNALALNPSGYGGATSAIYDESDWPVAIYCDLLRPGAKFGLHNVGSSTLHVMGDLDVGTGANANIYTRGDVRLGGEVSAGNVIYFPKGNSENNLRIRAGGSMTLSRPDVTKQTNQGESVGVSTLTVDEGASFTTQGDVYDPGRAQLAHVINGTAAILGGLAPTSRDQSFKGTGRLVCGTSYPTTNVVVRVVTLGGGLAFAPTGDWLTLTAQNDVYPLTIRVEGELTVDAGADWTYGAVGVRTETTAADRALVAAEGSTLTFAATDYVTRLADPIVSDGTVVFESGAKVEPVGDLYAVNWKTFAQAREFVGMPISSEGKFRIVDGEGCQLLQFKGRGGLAVFVR